MLNLIVKIFFIMSNSILNCVNFFVNFCRIFDYIYLIVTLLILKIHSSCPLKPLQVPPYALKTDSFQGLRPWTPPGGLQRPPNPQLVNIWGASPPRPPASADFLQKTLQN